MADEPRLTGARSWGDLFAALRAAGFIQAAVLVESWADEYACEPGDRLQRFEGDDGPVEADRV